MADSRFRHANRAREIPRGSLVVAWLLGCSSRSFVILVCQEPPVPEPSAFEVEMATEKLKKLQFTTY
jgi:hypothetical protein